MNPVFIFLFGSLKKALVTLYLLVFFKIKCYHFTVRQTKRIGSISPVTNRCAIYLRERLKKYIIEFFLSPIHLFISEVCSHSGKMA